MPQPSDYTNLDFASLRARLLALATSAFPDVPWDSAAQLEVLLLELNAYVGDVIAKYLNNNGREARWGTAQQRRSLLSLIKLIGYKAPGARAAQLTEVFTLSAPAIAPVTFPAGTVVQTAEVTSPVKFQLLAPLTIAAGQTSASATVEHSAPGSDAFASTGLADQSYILSQTPYLDGSAVVTAADGTYVEVLNFLASRATDRHFTTSVDDLDRATIKFGDGVSGAIPSGTITVDYKTGGGVAGNVSAGKVVAIIGNFTDTNGTPVRVTVTNPVGPDVRGVDRSSVAQIRTLAPESLRVLGRAVAREDYEIVARGVPGVARTLCLTRNEEAGVQENSGILFLVPTGGGVASTALCASVLAQFFGPTAPTPTLNTFQLSAQTAAYLVVNIAVKAFVRKGYLPATVAADVRSRLAKFFAATITPADLAVLAPEVAKQLGYPSTDTKSLVSNPLVDFGFMLQDEDGNPTGSFAWSDVFNLIRDTSGLLRIPPDVDALLLNGLRQDVPITNFQFPALGTVTFINAADGSTV